MVNHVIDGSERFKRRHPRWRQLPLIICYLLKCFIHFLYCFVFYWKQQWCRVMAIGKQYIFLHSFLFYLFFLFFLYFIMIGLYWFALKLKLHSIALAYRWRNYFDGRSVLVPCVRFINDNNELYLENKMRMRLIFTTWLNQHFEKIRTKHCRNLYHHLLTQTLMSMEIYINREQIKMDQLYLISNQLYNECYPFSPIW